MKNETFEKKVKMLREIEAKRDAMDAKAKAIRMELLNHMSEQRFDTYKFDGVATISRKIVKRVKFAEEEMFKYLEKFNVVRYLTLVPEHHEISKDLTDDIKAGKFMPNLDEVTVEVEEKEEIAVRFVKVGEGNEVKS